MVGDYLVCREENGKVKAFIHIYQTGDINGIKLVKFRDYMNNHEEEKKRYEALKMELYNKYRDDRNSYTLGKGDYIMATTKDYKEFVLEQLSILDNITCRPMMGEYLLYYNGVLFGGIYDDRLLVKKVNSNSKYHMEEAIPYDGAKSMYLVDDIDNKDVLKDIVIDTYKDLLK